MTTTSYKTISANNKTVRKNWHVIDAENQVVGRLCSKIAHVLRGKHKPYYTPHVDCGDFVIVLNADKVRFTGNKTTEKQYIRYTGYPGGQRFATPKHVLETHPERVIEHAVRGMLPKNRLGRQMFKKMFIYTGTDHPHQAQQPKPLNI